MYWYSVLIVTATLTILSFDRFLSIVKPFVHKQYMKPQTAMIIVVITWITSAILNTNPLYGFGKFIFGREHGTCVPIWTKETLYLVFTVIVFLILIGIIIFTSIWTCCFTRRYLQRRHSHKNNIYISNNRRVIGIFG